ncbi:MAG TPA: hypothetical protein VHJ82_04220, partial [Actinomycetota bacterium]|nr:hypothetical protein [Actinomycetota bacterium]
VGNNACPTRDEALKWAEARVTEYSVSDLQIRSRDGGEGCYRGRIEWQTAEVWVDEIGNQT